MAEVGEQAIGAGGGEPDARGPGAVGAQLGVEVLEAGQIAPGDDQVHALLVRDVEVAHRAAVRAGDPEAQRLGAAAVELRVGDDDPHAVLSDGEAANLVGRVGHVGVLPWLAGRRGPEGGAGEGADAEEDGEHGDEARDLRGRAHAASV